MHVNLYIIPFESMKQYTFKFRSLPFKSMKQYTLNLDHCHLKV